MRLAPLLVLAVGCASPELFVVPDVRSGDTLVVVEGIESETASVFTRIVGERASVEFPTRDGASLAVIVLRPEDFVDPTGLPLDLSSLRADLDGDGGCGCIAPHIEGPRAMFPGDRCALAEVDAISMRSQLDSEWIPDIRERLRLERPGSCACAAGAGSAPPEVELCMLGEAAARSIPEALAIASDGTIFAGTRGMIEAVSPAGAVTRVGDVMTELFTLAAGEDGSVIAFGKDEQQLTGHTGVAVCGRRGAASSSACAARVVAGREITGQLSSSSGTWLFGSAVVGGTVGAGAALLWCSSLGPDPVCLDVASEAPGCAHLNPSNSAPIERLAELADGSIVALHKRGALSVVRVQPGSNPPTCLAPTHVRLPDGSEPDIANAPQLTAAGSRIAVCVELRTDAPNKAVYLSADVGGLGDAPDWEEVARAAFCSKRSEVQDVVRGRGYMAFVDNTKHVQVSTSAATLEQGPPYGGELPVLIAGVATNVRGAIAVVATNGEIWAKGPLVGDRFNPVRARETPLAATVTPLATARGFRLLDGTEAPRELRVEGLGCGDLALSASTAAPSAATTDTAATPFGDGALVFRAQGSDLILRRIDGDGRVVDVRLEDPPAPPSVRAAIEVVPGAWAVFITGAGELWATDGSTAEQLDPTNGDWVALTGRPFVGFAARPDELVRIRAIDGRLRLERDLLPADKPKDATITAIQATCDGRVFVAFDDRTTAPNELSSEWVLGPTPTGLALTRLDLHSRSRILAIQGGDHPAWINLFGQVLVDEDTIPDATLPFGRSVCTACDDTSRLRMATRGSDVLVTGAEGRAALIRITRP